MIGNGENTSICEKDTYGTFFDDATSETSLLNNEKYVYRPKYCMNVWYHIQDTRVLKLLKVANISSNEYVLLKLLIFINFVRFNRIWIINYVDSLVINY